MKGLLIIDDRVFMANDPQYWALRVLLIDPDIHVVAAGQDNTPAYLGQIAMPDEEAWEQIANEGRLTGTKVG